MTHIRDCWPDIRPGDLEPPAEPAGLEGPHGQSNPVAMRDDQDAFGQGLVKERAGMDLAIRLEMSSLG